ncbi:SAVED domain-containing protein [Clostridium sp.]|jgi:hypothetical protein|uniref:SAVED domain-containing protein n=1 Tax=Clostridium sp. TaxID=1506 RepID=UPI003EEB8945
MKKGLIKYFKTVKLRYIAIATVTMSFVLSGNVIGSMSENVQTQQIKDILLMYKDLAILVERLLPYSYMRWIVSIMIILFWALIVYVRFFYEKPIQNPKKTIHILAHSSLSKTQFKFNEESLKIFQPIIEELDLIEDLKVVKENYTMIQAIVTKQDNLIEKFKGKINNDDKYGYMGISHTPLILRAGYKIGDETKFTMLHKKRNVDYYEQLNNSEVYSPIKIEKKNIKDNCTELIVAISTTFPIEDNQLNILQPENKSILKFKTDELGFDVITSEKQVEDYVSYILREVRQIRRDKGITKIHMILSSSVAFTFALGQGLSSNYDTEIIVYHFDMKNPKKYPWGISIFEESMNCVVVK